jgi:hypothetical protein
MSGLSDADRQRVEAAVASVVDAIARVPSQNLADTVPSHTLQAIVDLFDLHLPA